LTIRMRYLIALLLISLGGAGALWADDSAATLPGGDQATQLTVQSWKTKSAEVLADAQTSGRPIYAYIWTRFEPACNEMSSQTLMYDLVVAQLQGFERLAVDALNQQNFPFLDQYKVPYVKLAPLNQPIDPNAPTGPTPPQDMTVQARAEWPTNLFLDSQGKEIFRVYGFVAGKQFAQMLGQVQELAKQWDLLRQNPNSLAAEAALGHLYLQLKVFGESRKHLQHALALDPQNTSGVLPDVQLDLTILALPDDTQAGALALVDWQKRNPHHPRLLEAVYYQAVAEVNNGDLGGAVKLLNRFAQAKPGSPESKSEWFVPACSLLLRIQQQQGSH